MKCSKCKKHFLESDIQLSHDVPCYLFEGRNRKERKNRADKHGRHNLCKKCHDIYEKTVFGFVVSRFSKDIKAIMIKRAKTFAKGYF